MNVPLSRQQFESYSAWRSNNSSPTTSSSSSQQPSSMSMSIPKSKSALSVAANNCNHKDRDRDSVSPMGKSASAASFSPSSGNHRKRLSVDAARNRAFVNESSSGNSSAYGAGDMVLSSPGGSPSTRHRNRNTLASHLDDMSFADEELTEMVSELVPSPVHT